MRKSCQTMVGLGESHGVRTTALLNVVMLPMWILSGVFFSSENFPDAVQPFIQALPLTALNQALRAVMIDGASWTAYDLRMRPQRPTSFGDELARIGYAGSTPPSTVRWR